MSLRIIGLKLQRKLITVPVAEDVVGCLVPTPEQCAALSGSDPQPCDPCEAPACVTTCGQCPGGMSGVWLLPFGDDVIRLCHVEAPNDGNACRFLSADLAWELSYVESAGVALWQLVNYDRGLFYFVDADLWNCLDDNTLEDLDGNPVTVSPLSICDGGPSSYNCSGSGPDAGCLQVAGTGGAYATLVSCQAVCGPVVTDCCAEVGIARTLYLTITASDLQPALIGTHTLTWNGTLWTADVSVPPGDVWTLRVGCEATGTAPPFDWHTQAFFVTEGPPTREDAHTPTADATCSPFGYAFADGGASFIGSVSDTP